jgi:hypothetical protein
MLVRTNEVHLDAIIEGDCYLIIWPVPEETIWEELGYSTEQIDAMKKIIAAKPKPVAPLVPEIPGHQNNPNPPATDAAGAQP